jgi:RNA polymerase sigma factor (sigma-70 family)
MKDWTSELNDGRSEAAWDAFLDRYRRLIFAAIRHHAHDGDEVMDAFVWVCEALRADDMKRLRRYGERKNHAATFSTWLVTVVRHLTIDWYRHHEGRKRLSAAAERLPALQRRIFQHVFLEQRSHLEAYELIRSRDGDLSYRVFLAELRETYRSVASGRSNSVLRELGRPAPDSSAIVDWDSAEVTSRRAALDRVLASLDDTDRAAVLLYVVEEVPAVDVARILGLSNAKAVYNRVYRALALIRDRLEQAGLGRGDI